MRERLSRRSRGGGFGSVPRALSDGLPVASSANVSRNEWNSLLVSERFHHHGDPRFLGSERAFHDWAMEMSSVPVSFSEAPPRLGSAVVAATSAPKIKPPQSLTGIESEATCPSSQGLRPSRGHFRFFFWFVLRLGDRRIE